MQFIRNVLFLFFVVCVLCVSFCCCCYSLHPKYALLCDHADSSTSIAAVCNTCKRISTLSGSRFTNRVWERNAERAKTIRWPYNKLFNDNRDTSTRLIYILLFLFFSFILLAPQSLCFKLHVQRRKQFDLFVSPLSVFALEMRDSKGNASWRLHSELSLSLYLSWLSVGSLVLWYILTM